MGHGADTVALRDRNYSAASTTHTTRVRSCRPVLRPAAVKGLERATRSGYSCGVFRRAVGLQHGLAAAGPKCAARARAIATAARRPE